MITFKAHGLGQCIQLNYIVEQGGFEFDEKSKRFSVNFSKISQAVSNLTRNILMMQGDGDKARVERFILKYGKISDEVKGALETCGNVYIYLQIYDSILIKFFLMNFLYILFIRTRKNTN